MHWNWSQTYQNWFIFGILISLSWFVYQNLWYINTMFISQIPVGTIILFVLVMITLKHMYEIVVYWRLYLDERHKATNIIIDICGYLVILSIILSISIPMSYIIEPHYKLQNSVNYIITNKPSETNTVYYTIKIVDDSGRIQYQRLSYGNIKECFITSKNGIMTRTGNCFQNEIEIVNEYSKTHKK